MAEHGGKPRTHYRTTIDLTNTSQELVIPDFEVCYNSPPLIGPQGLLPDAAACHSKKSTGFWAGVFYSSHAPHKNMGRMNRIESDSIQVTDRPTEGTE